MLRGVNPSCSFSSSPFPPFYAPNSFSSFCFPFCHPSFLSVWRSLPPPPPQSSISQTWPCVPLHALHFLCQPASNLWSINRSADLFIPPNLHRPSAYHLEFFSSPGLSSAIWPLESSGSPTPQSACALPSKPSSASCLSDFPWPTGASWNSNTLRNLINPWPRPASTSWLFLLLSSAFQSAWVLLQAASLLH